jgi:hypothetical protein
MSRPIGAKRLPDGVRKKSCHVIVHSRLTWFDHARCWAEGASQASLIDPDMVDAECLGKRRAGIRASSPPPPDGDIENEIERVVEHPL